MKPNAKAVAGCKACAQSVSGVCIKHNQPDIENHPRRCIGINDDGARCRKWGRKETNPPTCVQHDPDNEVADAAKRKPGQGRSTARRAAKAVGNTLDLLGKDYETIDSLEKLEALAAEALLFKDYLREQMRHSIATSDEDIEKNLNRYVTALDRCGKLLETFSKQGLQERELKMREELVGLVTGLFNTVLATYIPAELQPQAQSALATAVATLEPQKQLTAGAA